MRVWKWLRWLWDHIYAIGDRAGSDHIYMFASGIAFTLITSLVPTILLILVVLSNYLETPTVMAALNKVARQFIVGGYRDDFLQQIAWQKDALIANRPLATILGLFGLLWTSSALASSIRTAVNNVLKCKLQRNFLIYKLYDLLIVILIGLLVFASVIIGPFLQILLSTTNRIEGLLQIAGLDFLVSEFLSFGITLLLFFVIFRFMPYQRQKRRVIVIATVASTLLWEGARYVFTYYLSRFSTFSKIYGAYAFLAIAAIWIYYTALVFLIGAEIAHYVSTTGWDPWRMMKRLPVLRNLRRHSADAAGK